MTLPERLLRPWRLPPWFRARHLAIEGRDRPLLGTGYLVGVVTGGAGRIRAGSGDLAVRRGETFAVPAAVLATLATEAEPTLALIARQGVMEET